MTAVALAVAAGAVPASAAPCRPALTDPRGDTYEWTVVGFPEPGADILSLHLRADATTLHVVTTLLDVDAPITTAPLGRSTSVLFTLGEKSFQVRHEDTVEGRRAALSLMQITRSGGNAASAMAATGTKVADLDSEVDPRTNEIRVRVPLAELRKHTTSARKGAFLVVHDVQTMDHTGTDQAATGGTIDLTMPDEATWRFGSC